MRGSGRLWQSLAVLPFIARVRPFHDCILARVQNDGEYSGQFPVTDGVKRGCVLAATEFSMMFSATLTEAFQDGDNEIPINAAFGQLRGSFGIKVESDLSQS